MAYLEQAMQGIQVASAAVDVAAKLRSVLKGNAPQAAQATGLSLKQVSAIRAAPAARRRALLASFMLQSVPQGKTAKPLKASPKKSELFESMPVIGARIAPRGHGYYDAFANPPNTAMTAMSIGLATPIVGRARSQTYTTGPGTADMGTTDGNSVLIWFQPGHAHEISAIQYTLTLNGTLAESAISCTQLQGLQNVADGEGTEQITTRASIRLQNITESRNVGGVVRVLRYGGGYPPLADAADYAALTDMIRDSQHTVVYSGTQLTSPKQKNCYIVDQSRATQFDSVRGIHDTMRSPYLTNIFILIDKFVPGDGSTGTNNTYEVSIAVQRLARFNPGTLLHGMAYSIPADMDHANRHRDAEEKHGSAFLSALGAGLQGATKAFDSVVGGPLGSGLKGVMGM